MNQPDRKLKIEAAGDFWKGVVRPKIRLMGRWLQNAGFNPGTHVRVTCVAPGVIELRAPNTPMVNEVQPDESSASM